MNLNQLNADGCHFLHCFLHRNNRTELVQALLQGLQARSWSNIKPALEEFDPNIVNVVSHKSHSTHYVASVFHGYLQLYF